MSEPQPPLGFPGTPGREAGPAEPEGYRAPDPISTTEEPASQKKRRSHRTLIEWAAILVVAVVAAVLLRTFVIQPYYIPSDSMEPTLKVGDKVLVNKLSYHMHGVHRGDVVVFEKPPNDYSPDIKDLIKRIIGLPNETISGRDGHVYIDGRLLNEKWLPNSPSSTTSSFGPVHIPAGDYFVMGDNRTNSSDSRVIGPIPGSLIVGRAFLIVWPVGHISGL